MHLNDRRSMRFCYYFDTNTNLKYKLTQSWLRAWVNARIHTTAFVVFTFQKLNRDKNYSLYSLKEVVEVIVCGL